MEPLSLFLAPHGSQGLCPRKGDPPGIPETSSFSLCFFTRRATLRMQGGEREGIEFFSLSIHHTMLPTKNRGFAFCFNCQPQLSTFCIDPRKRITGLCIQKDISPPFSHSEYIEATVFTTCSSSFPWGHKSRGLFCLLRPIHKPRPKRSNSPKRGGCCCCIMPLPSSLLSDLSWGLSHTHTHAHARRRLRLRRGRVCVCSLRARSERNKRTLPERRCRTAPRERERGAAEIRVHDSFSLEVGRAGGSRLKCVRDNAER